MLSFFVIISLFIFVYSYGFIDLNLTLSSNPQFLALVDPLRTLVYFNRPLSLKIYLAIIIALFLIYYFIIKNYSPKSLPWKYIIIFGLIFTFSYPFLSHDMFKYLYSAKMVVLYRLNPHTHSPDFIADDLWLRFLRWSNTPSPYGPVFTLFSIPPYILGLGKFVPSMYLFKLMNFLWYLLSIKLIGVISLTLKHTKKQIVRNQLFFALSPLIIIEGLSNAHNDIIMIALYLLALSLLLKRKYVHSALSLAFSVGIKYITILLLPFYFLRRYLSNSQIINSLAVIFLVSPILYYKQYQPWYVIWFVSSAALTKSQYLRNLSLALSIGSMLKYSTFVRTGGWTATSTGEYTAIIFALPALYTIIYLFRSRRLV